ncbi:MAG: NAD(P)/FAD-dependent oxidoreductase [Dehalococcoidia bacterium]|nr:NAD(P)/FAD-dependent oxidoreductase [Dehalococcoidia bacterium]
MQRARVVIVGAGFAGLSCAQKLAGKRVSVLLVDANNYHLFTPLLYQVASSLLNPSDIARSVRAIFRRSPNVRFRQGRVVAIDVGARTVRTADGGAILYDYLVLASGSTTNFYGMADVEERAFGLKDLPEALELRNHILGCLEVAARSSPTEAEPWLTFLLVGGGPTGVEYAGALSELIDGVLPDEYPDLADRPIRIVLVEALDRVLPTFPEDLSRDAQAELRRRGVEVVTGVRVAAFAEDAVRLSDGSVIRSRTLVWAAGVRPSDLAGALGSVRSRSGRIEVDGFLRVRGLRDVFAIGDVASVLEGGQEVPMLSAPAMQEGRAVARNVLRAVRGQPGRAFRYRDRGSMATIGRNAAVAELGPVHLTGFAGWATWLVVHLYYIIGFRNRLAVLLGWAWNYVQSDRPVRIIARARGREDQPAAVPEGRS